MTSVRKTLGNLNINTVVTNSPLRKDSKSLSKKMERLELVKAQKPKQVVLGTDVKSKGKPFIFKAAAGTKGTMSQSVQTNSNCTCDFYDETGLEMMASENQVNNYYKTLADELRPTVNELKNKSFELTSILKEKEEECSTLERSINESLELIDIGRKMAEVVKEYDNTVLPIINRDDSGFTEASTSVSTATSEPSKLSNVVAESLTKEEDALDDVDGFSDDIPFDLLMKEMEERDEQIKKQYESTPLPKSNNRKRVAASSGPAASSPLLRVWASSSKSSKTSLLSNNSCSKYIQASLCCMCDYTDEEQIELMCKEEQDERDYQFEVNKLRREMKTLTEDNESLPESISALDEKLETLRGDNELVLEKVADVKELMKLADSAILGDSGLADDLKDA